MSQKINKLGPRDFEVIVEETVTTTSTYNYDEVLKLRDGILERRNIFNKLIDQELADVKDLLAKFENLGIEEAVEEVSLDEKK